jgi:hypothetical protein
MEKIEMTVGKTLTLNAFGVHGSIIKNPDWIIWSVTPKGTRSDRYGDHHPVVSTSDMDFAIEWVFGGYRYNKGDAQFKGYILYQLHRKSKRLFKHTYKAKKEEALFEKKGGKWVYVD